MRADEEAVLATLTVRVTPVPGRRVLALTTWGVVAGSYGSMGRVEISLDEAQIPETKAELARLLLTALYGLDYDL